VPEISGLYYVGLSVRDIRKSMTWYADALGLTTVLERIPDDGSTGEVLLRHPTTGMLLGLLSHQANPGDPFSEFRTGLDHLEFGVANRQELEAWMDHLDHLAIEHSPIKERPAAFILTFRDPDNIQLEFYALKDSDGGPRETP
jgi:catechol 2,3-dioxygenase-like lactoylglutathione lyase family enzyme